MRHAGVHWATGPILDSAGHEDNEALLSLPGSATIIPEPSARWQYQRAKDRRPDMLAIWRAVARDGEKPAQLGWDARRFVQASLVSLDEYVDQGRGQPPSDFCHANELELNTERGDHEPDTDPAFWRGRFARIAVLNSGVQAELRRQGFNGKLWYPPSAPGHGHHDHVDLWGPVARTFDGVIFHAYTDWETIRAEYDWYRAQFPGMPLTLGEWNSDGLAGDLGARIAEERRILAGLAGLCQDDPNFWACYFIWEWQGGVRQDFNVRGVPDRMALFMNPPVSVVPVPVPAPVPVPPPPPPPAPEPTMKVYTNDEIRAIARQAAAAHGIPEILLLACGIAEGGLRQFARRPATQDKDAASWPDISTGVFQQSVRWAPEYQGGNGYPGDAEIARVGDLYFDVPHAAGVAAGQLRSYWNGQSDDASLLAALFLYNSPAGQGKPRNATVAKNYQGGLAAAHALLDAQPLPGPEVRVPNYQFGIKALADQLGADVVGQPLGDEQYITPDYSLQMSEKGMFFYSRQGNRVIFLPARLA